MLKARWAAAAEMWWWWCIIRRRCGGQRRGQPAKATRCARCSLQRSAGRPQPCAARSLPLLALLLIGGRRARRRRARHSCCVTMRARLLPRSASRVARFAASRPAALLRPKLACPRQLPRVRARVVPPRAAKRARAVARRWSRRVIGRPCCSSRRASVANFASLHRSLGRRAIAVGRYGWWRRCGGFDRVVSQGGAQNDAPHAACVAGGCRLRWTASRVDGYRAYEPRGRTAAARPS